MELALRDIMIIVLWQHVSNINDIDSWSYITSWGVLKSKAITNTLFLKFGQGSELKRFDSVTSKPVVCSILEEWSHPSRREFTLKTMSAEQIQRGWKDIHVLNFWWWLPKRSAHTLHQGTEKRQLRCFPPSHCSPFPTPCKTRHAHFSALRNNCFGQSLCKLTFTLCLLMLFFLVYTFWRKGDNEITWLERPFSHWAANFMCNKNKQI